MNVTVKITGPALAHLLSESINSSFDQEGFLLGSITKAETLSVTDDSREDIRINCIVKVTSVFPCDIPHHFYKNNGELETDQLKEMLGNRRDEVVAWYRYKKSSKLGFSLTLRERILFEELRLFFDIPAHVFTCCILSTTVSENHSTYKFSHTFVNHEGIVPDLIENLGDQCHTYQRDTKPSNEFLKLFSTIDKNQSDLQIANDLQNLLQNETQKALAKAARTEQELHKLNDEVKILRIELRKRHLAKIASQMEIMHVTCEQMITVETNDPIQSQQTTSDDHNVNNGSVELSVIDLTLTEEE